MRKWIALIAAVMTSSVFAYNPTITLEYDVKVKTDRTDIVFVIDNSGSMEAHQKTLQKLSQSFLNELKGLNYQITTIATDHQPEQTNQVLVPETTDGNNLFAKMMTQHGTNGDATELVFGSLFNFLTSEFGLNFIRPQTALEVILLTDEEEQSHQSTEEILSLINNQEATVSAIIPAKGSDCVWQGEDDFVKFEEILAQTQGARINICSEETIFSTDYTQLAKDIFNRASKGDRVAVVPLKSYAFPHEIDLESVKVFYGNQVIPRGVIGYGWQYNQDNNTILFGNRIALSHQVEGTKFTIQYDVK